MGESRASRRNNVAKHYKKEDILKNRVANTEKIFKNKRKEQSKSMLPALNEKESKMDEFAEDFVE